MKKWLIPALCLLHMTAIFWWTLPHSFGGMVVSNARQTPLEARLFKWMMLDENSWAYSFLQKYIDVTGANSTGIFLRRKVPDSINTCLFAIRLVLILIRAK